jgi:HSP20 family protein
MYQTEINTINKTKKQEDTMLVRYQTIPSLFSEIDELINDSFPVYRRSQYGYAPLGVSMKDSGDAITVAVELPGIHKQDVKVTVHDDVLSISAERKHPELTEKEQWIRNEIRYGKYERSIKLNSPVVADKVTAVHENGILKISLPKAEEAKPKEIVIK